MNYMFKMYPTVITPFTPDGAIDYESYERLIDLFARNECDGLFAVCQSSEMFYLSEEEKLELASFSIRLCKEKNIKCVVSGHTQETLQEQIAYLQKAELLGADALILVSNRLAAEDENDEILIENLSSIIDQLNPDTRLGIYECPYPYKRLLTPQVLEYMVGTGRFDFIKDTSCDIDLIRQRLSQLKGTGTELYNANAATLVDSFLAGAAGYSGVMLNFIPEHFMKLRKYLSTASSAGESPASFNPRTARWIGDFITMASVYEYQGYPRNAKYFLVRRGIIASDMVRNNQKELTETQCRELKAFANTARSSIAQIGPVSSPELIFPEQTYFRSCHASTVLPLEDGTVLAAYFAGTAEGNPDVGIWLSRRVNGEWQEPVQIAKTEQTAHWNPVLFKTPDEVRIVYKVGEEVASWKSRTMVSRDQGLTWSPEASYPPPNDACGPVRSKPLLMSNGRMLAPNSDEKDGVWLPRVDVSDDYGESFKLLSKVRINRTNPDEPDYIEGEGAIQPTLWESEPGHIHMFLRTTCGYIFRSDSKDYGESWSQAYNTYLPSNNSGIEVVSHGSDLYLILNPISGNWAARTPIVVYKSTDNGLSFDHFITLENRMFDNNNFIAEFSYPAAVVMDDTLYITYTYMRRQIAFHQIFLG
ncbi:MAG: dihydrodipicolinate synthase family protein [Caldicoprobacterales bacterium]|jgi:predicted neuraminidase/dihydrodipicolinate synthase/N-acetylneuraminate lyase